jgi:integrase
VIVLVAMHTGLRRENILSLHTDQDVEGSSGYVDFQERKIRVRQKRDLTHEVPMNATVYEALLRIRPESPGYYFPSRYKRNRPYTRFEGAWKTLKEAAGITRPFRFHDLRHHCATKALKATGNLALVGKFLGHRNLSTTGKYAHILMEDLREAARLLETAEKDNQRDNQAVDG